MLCQAKTTYSLHTLCTALWRVGICPFFVMHLSVFAIFFFSFECIVYLFYGGVKREKRQTKSTDYWIARGFNQSRTNNFLKTPIDRLTSSCSGSSTHCFFSAFFPHYWCCCCCCGHISNAYVYHVNWFGNIQLAIAQWKFSLDHSEKQLHHSLSLSRIFFSLICATSVCMGCWHPTLLFLCMGSWYRFWSECFSLQAT